MRLEAAVSWCGAGSSGRLAEAVEPFHRVVNRIRWTSEPDHEYVVGYADRFEETCAELPLDEFLESEVPRHRARYLKRREEIVWDRRPDRL